MSAPAKHGHQHRPGGPDPIPALAIYEIKCFDDFTTVVVGDGIFEFEIPEDLDGAELVKVEAFVSDTSSVGAVEVSLTNSTTAVEMLSTHIFIGSGDLNSKDYATQPVVDLANAVVSWGDHVAINVVDSGSDAIGLGVILAFASSAVASVVLAGAKGDQGDPGGVTAWQGGWDAGTTYTTADSVSYNGTSYVARTGSTGVEPGVTSGWETYWQVLATGGAGDGWTSDTVNTWTYVSATSFKVSGVDVTAQFEPGTRIRLKQGGAYKYFVVASSSFSTDTTVTITGGDDYSLANAAITDNGYSYQANPEGYPNWFNYTPTYGGFSSPPGAGTGRFSVVGRTCFYEVATGFAASNASTFTVSTPIPSAVIGVHYTAARGLNNGTELTAPSMVEVASGSTWNIYRSFQIGGTAWTASGNKGIYFLATYEI